MQGVTHPSHFTKNRYPASPTGFRPTRRSMMYSSSSRREYKHSGRAHFSSRLRRVWRFAAGKSHKINECQVARMHEHLLETLQKSVLKSVHQTQEARIKSIEHVLAWRTDKANIRFQTRIFLNNTDTPKVIPHVTAK